MVGGGGTKAANVVAPSAAEIIAGNKAAATNSPEAAALMAQYGQGKLSLADALSQAQTLGGKYGATGATAGTAATAGKAGGTPDQIAQAQHSLDAAYAGGNQTEVDSAKAAMDALKATPGTAAVAATPGVAGAGGASALMSMLATDPATAQRFATEQVQTNPMLSKYFGQGGMQDQVLGAQAGLDKNLASDRNALLGKDESYGLTPNDLKAYGQASDMTARMFGGQEQGLAQSLNDRGLGAGASGSAGAQFSGLQGNKMEQLGQQQQQIANNRIQTAQGLAQFRSQADEQQAARNQQTALALGQQGENAITNDRSQNTGAQGQMQNQLATQEQLGQQLNEDQQSQENIGFMQQQKTKTPSLIDTLTGAAGNALGSVVGSGVQKGAGALMGML